MSIYDECDYDDMYLLDLESEMFIENMFGASLLTNLDQSDRFVVQQCIIEFDLYHNIFLNRAYDIHGHRIFEYFGLYITNRAGDLGDFWKRFDELKGRNK